VSASASVACEPAIILFTLAVIARRRQHQAQHLRSSCLSAQPIEFEPTIIDAVSDVPYSIFFYIFFYKFYIQYHIYFSVYWCIGAFIEGTARIQQINYGHQNIKRASLYVHVSVVTITHSQTQACPQTHTLNQSHTHKHTHTTHTRLSAPILV
jgi:hypothetical protein